MLDMPGAAKRVFTFDEIYAQIARLPEGVTGEILAPGVLSTMSRPGLAHAHTADMVADALRRHGDSRFGGRGWWIYEEVEVRLPGDRLVVPDLGGWRVERVARLPEENPVVILPDWCAEVLSPGTAAVDRSVKLPLYARCGIGHVWLVDPELRLVEVYESTRERPTLVASLRDAETAVLPPFETEMCVGSWWRA
jgi:Uma2 family endonuclease